MDYGVKEVLGEHQCDDSWADHDENWKSILASRSYSPEAYLRYGLGRPFLQDYLDEVRYPHISFNGVFAENDEGRHVLHQMANDFRSETFTFNRKLWLDAQWLTHKFLPDGLNARTTGTRPPQATILSSVCKLPWKAQGCQPQEHLWVVEQLLLLRHILHIVLARYNDSVSPCNLSTCSNFDPDRLRCTIFLDSRLPTLCGSLYSH